ncbi:unnamed protein product, partial [Rotaria socialis]
LMSYIRFSTVSLSTTIQHDPSDFHRSALNDSYRYDQDDTLWDRYI